MDQIATVLRTQRLSPSINYRVYRENVQGQPLLTWWIDLFRSRFPSTDLYIHATTRDDKAALESIVNGSVPIIYTNTSTRLHDAARTAEQLGRDHVAFVDYGLAFSPNDILDAVRHHHLQHANEYTPIMGFPLGAAPEIYNTRFLTELSALPFPNTADPAEIAGRLVSGSKAIGMGSFSIQAIPFNAAEYYTADFRLPQSILVQDDTTIEIVRRLSRLGRFGSKLEGLKRWRDCAIDVHEHWKQRSLKLASTVSLKRPQDNVYPRRILFVSNPAGFSGAEESLCQLISHIDKSRFDLYAIIGGEGTFEHRLRSMGVKVSVCHHFGYDGLEHMLSVAALFSDVRPHIVHFNALSGFPPLYASALMQLPIIVHCRNAHMPGFEELVRFADKIIAVSEFEKQRVLGLEVPEQRVDVIYDEVDSSTFRRELFDRHSLRRKFCLPLEAKIVLMIARFVPSKRYDLLLDAAQLLKASIPELHLLLKGDVFYDSTTYNEVLAKIGHNKMDDWVTIFPFVEDIRELHSVSDALVLCSDEEALGRCVVEAMSMQTPVVITTSGGATEIVKHRETGLVAPHDNPEALSEQLRIALSDDVLSQRIASSARHYVEKHLDARVSAKRVMSLYDDLLRTAC